MRHSAVAVALVTLACSGLIPADPPASPSGPTRTPNTGDVVPIGLVELAYEGNGRCGITVRTFPGDEEIRLGSFAPLCPTEALVTWTGERVVFVDEGGVWVEAASGTSEGKEVPAPPQIVVFDDAGDLHACASIEVDAKSKNDSTMSAEWNGKTFTTDKLDKADGYRMWVHWKLDGKDWKVAEASLEADTEPDEVPVCQRLPEFPKDDPWVSSAGPEWSVADWPEPAMEDQAPLNALSAARWRVDHTKTLAIVGEVDDQRFTPRGSLALWVDDAWKQVHDSVDALWLADDWVAVDDGGELSLISRRDGTVAYEDPEKVLAFPWPAEAPTKAVEAPPEPEPEPEAPKEAKEPAAGEGGYGPGKAGKGR